MKQVKIIIGYEFGQPLYHIMWLPGTPIRNKSK